MFRACEEARDRSRAPERKPPMSDKFVPLSADRLARWISRDLQRGRGAFGVPEGLFWAADSDSSHSSEPMLGMEVFGRKLETPLGVAAGPHTQLAENIVMAWLVGARFMELKTIQTLDDLDIAKPCIDAEDATFNCEWSQELPLTQSIDEYVKAWVLVHALNKRLRGNDDTADPGFVFNMSVGYNLEGIQKPNVQAFLDAMADASEAIERTVAEASPHFPELEDLDIPTRISDNVTLSTMHGCPPEEIEQIASYLLEERKLHTTIKLNPTLLGPERLRRILNEQLGFSEIVVPDEAFEHDPKLEDAVAMIRRLSTKAANSGLTLGLKLTNTLEVKNHRSVFPPGQDMMYMSGRALHPVTAAVGRRVVEELGFSAPISFSGGADAFNVADLLASGYAPVTVSTDLLKPGGYARLPQYMHEIGNRMRHLGCSNLDELAMETAARHPSFVDRFLDGLKEALGEPGLPAVAENVATAAERARGQAPSVTFSEQWKSIVEKHESPQPLMEKALSTCWKMNGADYADRAALESAYRAPDGDVTTKNDTPLGWFDCVAAPCRVECPAGQNIPDYMHLVAEDRFAEALEVIRDTNAMPFVTGAVCDHPCTTKCVRNHYDDPLAIREIKRAAAIHGHVDAGVPHSEDQSRAGAGPVPVAVIGAGPAGLSAAYFLLRQNHPVTIFEAREEAGGMTSSVIPSFRLGDGDTGRDIDVVAGMGAEIRLNQQAGKDFTIDSLREEGFGPIFLGLGAPVARMMGIPGEDAEGVMDCLSFLQKVRKHGPESVDLGEHAVVVGGGNSAVDAARTAWRLVDRGKVTVLYRRSRAEMPADPEEIHALAEEGVELMELVTPVRAIEKDGKLAEVECVRMRLTEPDASGRPRPVPIEGSEFRLPCSSMIVGIGQKTVVDFLADTRVEVRRNGTIAADPETLETAEPGLYAGGDVCRGPATIIKAVADGRRAAGSIIEKTSGERPVLDLGVQKKVTDEELLRRKSIRRRRSKHPALAVSKRKSFEEVTPVLSREEAREEAKRCLLCSEMCSLCVTVCPNRANQTYRLDSLCADLPVLTVSGDGERIEHDGSRRCEIAQSHQIINIADLCNECGNCRTFCPTAGAPYRDKPRLHLNRTSYESEESGVGAVYISKPDRHEASHQGGRAHRALAAKLDSGEHELEHTSEGLCYRSPLVSAVIDPTEWKVIKAEPGPRAKAGDEIDLTSCVQMFGVLEGAGALLDSLLEE